MSTLETQKHETLRTPNIGEILKEEFLEPLDITPYRLAKELHVSTSTVLDLLHGKRRLSTDMALRLSGGNTQVKAGFR